MKSGPGFWLDPDTECVYQVETTHNDWMLCSENQQKIGLPAQHVEALETLDPIREIDEIRMVGVIFGLIRVRDYQRHLSIQFYSQSKEVIVTLKAIESALPKLFSGIEHFLHLHNLFDDSHAKLWSPEFIQKLKEGETILEPAGEAIEYNEKLRKKMERLLKEQL